MTTVVLSLALAIYADEYLLDVVECQAEVVRLEKYFKQISSTSATRVAVLRTTQAELKKAKESLARSIQRLEKEKVRRASLETARLREWEAWEAARLRERQTSEQKEWDLRNNVKRIDDSWAVEEVGYVKESVKVLQVVNGNNLLGKSDEVVYWLVGGTRDLADGDHVRVGQVRYVGTTQYTSPLGATKTVRKFVMIKD